MPNDEISLRDQLWVAVFRGQLDIVLELCRRHPELRFEGDCCEDDPILVLAAGEDSEEILKALLDAGFDVNVKHLPEKTTPIASAIDNDLEHNVKLIIQRKPDLSIGRPIISALNARIEPSRRLNYVKWLVEAGADVNQLHDLYGDPDKQFTALDWTDEPAVIEYLRSKGAKKAAELRQAGNVEKGNSTPE